jgi:hypothetical protein
MSAFFLRQRPPVACLPGAPGTTLLQFQIALAYHSLLAIQFALRCATRSSRDPAIDWRRTQGIERRSSRQPTAKGHSRCYFACSIASETLVRR